MSLLYCIESFLFFIAGMSLVQMCWTPKGLWVVSDPPEFVLCKDMTSLVWKIVDESTRGVNLETFLSLLREKYLH